jgi:bifunctional UDP-N-acetylglucosamine pyrophosphorylase / glucosamine-1-phosphate N-acetyltransferase
MSGEKVTAIILAAGKGTRMKSDRAKVLHEINNKPMVHMVIDFLSPLSIKQIITVVGHQGEIVKKSMLGYEVDFVYQTEQLGTGHAVSLCESTVRDGIKDILILCGDSPLFRTETILEFLSAHQDSSVELTLMTAKLDEPGNYGRVVCNKDNQLERIVEAKDATLAELEINEINTGVYCVNKDVLFESLKEVNSDNAQNEIYLTDIVGIIKNKNGVMGRYCCQDATEIIGINSKEDLDSAHKILKQHQAEE